MAWEWSHSPEAYSNARANLYAAPRKFLEIALAEFRATPHNDGVIDSSRLDLELYQKALTDVKTIPDDCLADEIWSCAEQFRTCDTGGHRAWVCPHGCHTVSFDDEGNPYPE